MSQRRLRRSARAGLASAAATTLVLTGAAGPASAAPTMTLSSSVGLSGGGNRLVGTVAGTTTSVFVPGSVPAVQFQYSSCSAMAKNPVPIATSGANTTAGVVNADPADVRRITDTKITFEVPSSAYPATDSSGNASTVNPNGLVLGSGQTTARWSVCVYDSASTTAGTLLATASYTLVQRPTITAVTPAAGPAGGGTTITVTGTGFTAVTTPITAEIGGAELTNIRVAANGNSFTATTGPHGAGSGLELSVDTPGGRVGSLDPDNDSATNDAPITFTYSNGITIAPSTAAAGAVVTLDITGAGFADLLFDAAGGTPTSSRAHVFLVDGAYDPATNRGVAECTGVMVVADTELVCTLDLSTSRLDPATSQPVPGAAIVDGAYIVTVVATGDPGAAGAAHPTIISSGSVFVVAPY